MSRRRKWVLFVALGLSCLVVAVGVTAVLVLRSSWFSEKVRLRMIYEIERATGGRVELGSWGFNYATMTAHVERFVLRGTEAPNRAPFFRAGRVAVGLRIISLFKKNIELASAVIERPELHIYIAADGSDNIPKPHGPPSNKDFVSKIIDLKIQRYDLRDGFVEVDSRKIPLTTRGERLHVELYYQWPSVPGGPDARYRGLVTTRPVWVSIGPTDEMAFDADVDVVLEHNRIRIDSARLRMKESHIEATGSIDDIRRPEARFTVTATVAMSELARPLKLPLERRGMAYLAGRVGVGEKTPFFYLGTLRGTDLEVRSGDTGVRGMTLAADVRVSTETKTIEFADARVGVFGGEFRGRAELHEFRRFHAVGTASGMSVPRLSRLQGPRELEWNGTATGPVELEGNIVHDHIRGFKLRARMDIAPAQGAVPVQGSVDLAFDQSSDIISLGDSRLSTPATQMNFTGMLGRVLNVRVRSTNLEDVLPVIAMFTENPPKSFPVALANGAAEFDGTVAGPLKDPQIAGNLAVSSFEFEKHHFDRLTAALQVSEQALHVIRFDLTQGGTLLQGKGDVGLVNWEPNDQSPIAASVSLKQTDLTRLLAEFGAEAPVKGVVSATGVVKGTWGAPEAEATITAPGVTIAGEPFTRARFNVRYRDNSVEVVSGEASLNGSRIALSGAYDHARDDWKNGSARFNVAASGLALARSETVKKVHPGVQGSLDVKAAGTARVVKGVAELASLDGQAAVKGLVIDGKSTGDAAITAQSKGDLLSVHLNGDLRGSKLEGSGEWRLAGDYPGSGRVTFSRIAFSTIHDLLPGERQALPFDGALEGSVAFNGPALKPEDMRGRAEITTVEFQPAESTRFRTPAQRADLTLRNSGPIVLEMDGRAIRIRSALLTGKGTELRAAGAFSYQAKTPWDLQIDGTLNLATLRSFSPDILAAGSSALRGTVRGSADRPVVSGRMELKNASLYVEDVPNGIDNANGVILFDTNRATIEKLTAQTGGGNLDITGFVGFGGDEVIYRLQAKMDRVRVRYPEGVSTTVNSNVSLTGTSARSLLAGNIQVIRLGFNPRTDVGSLLAESAKPVPAPRSPSTFLQGLQFDVAIETAPNVEFRTSLTRDIQAEANLHLRGTPLRPVLLGRINVPQGEINFFGNKYTISHGEVDFFNPAKVEPVLNLDLETRQRGVVVTLHFAGPTNKLNVSYRSDPPLASQDIIALLTVGRAPDTASLAAGQAAGSQSFLQTSGNTLLGQAIAAPVSSRLQRFFGVSRLKIDPQLTTLENTPQARLTIEQQISNDITLTYVTNLANAQQQIVRLEWNLNKNWSVVGVREENGLVGIDFLFKKRLK